MTRLLGVTDTFDLCRGDGCFHPARPLPPPRGGSEATARASPEAVVMSGASRDGGSSPTAMPRSVNAIVAVCPDLGIGRSGQLPWHPVRLR